MKNFWKLYLAFVVLTLSWSLGHGATLHINNRPRETVNSSNTETLRLAKSAQIRNVMKPEVNACDDFYTYSCGNFGNTAESFFNALGQTYRKKVAKFLNQGILSTDGEFVRKVKYFYESCLERYPSGRKLEQALLSIMEEFGGMPALKGTDWQAESFDWLQVTAEILRKYGIETIIGVKVKPDITNTAMYRIYIGELDGIAPGNMEYYHNSFINYWQMRLENIFGMESAAALSTANEVVEFTKKLGNGVGALLKSQTLQEISKISTLAAMTDKYGPTLNFTKFVNTWLGYEYRQPVYEYVEGYLQNLRIVMAETPSSTVANYILLTLMTKIDFIMSNDHDEHEEKCIKLTQKYFFPYIDHLMYKYMVAAHPQIIDDVTTMFQHLKLTFAEMFKSSDMAWMTAQSTKDKALEKLSAMTIDLMGHESINFTRLMGPSLIITPDDYFANVLSIFKQQGQHFRSKVNQPASSKDIDSATPFPMYKKSFNCVAWPVYMFQPPHLWVNAYPQAVHYGTVGYIMAHEMVHAFDDSERMFDAKSNLNNWWDPVSNATFESRKDCMRQQYDGLMGGKEMVSQDENICDVSGLRIAYRAYNKWLSEQQQPTLSENLIHMESITPRQLFYIAAAQVWCSPTYDFWIGIGAHSPDKVRVQGMVSNSDAFAEAFECKVGSPMNPSQKCYIY